MPHLFVNRPRILDLTRGSTELRAQFRWETINAVFYKIGGVVFITGSILFFPRFEEYADLGAWTFFFGSLLYLVVTSHDLAEVIRTRHNEQYHDPFEVAEHIAAIAYLIGTILFTVGSVFFLSAIGLFIAGAWCFVIGSLLFVIGACVNVFQVQQGDTLLARKLMNYTAISFIIGSVLFTVASVPYLWDFEADSDRTKMYAFLAWQYLIGSTLFLLGGIFNYWRAYDFIKRQLRNNARKLK
jgi:hypothetical protein